MLRGRKKLVKDNHVFKDESGKIRFMKENENTGASYWQGWKNGLEKEIRKADCVLKEEK